MTGESSAAPSAMEKVTGARSGNYFGDWGVQLEREAETRCGAVHCRESGTKASAGDDAREEVEVLLH